MCCIIAAIDLIYFPRVLQSGRGGGFVRHITVNVSTEYHLIVSEENQPGQRRGTDDEQLNHRADRKRLLYAARARQVNSSIGLQ